MPVPCVYPEAPYSKFHALSVAPAVQLMSAPVAEIFDETIPVGAVPVSYTHLRAHETQ